VGLSRLLAGILMCTVSSSFLAAQEANVAVYAAMKGNPKPRLVQTNFAGDAVSIIDPATNKVVGEIPGIEWPMGLTCCPHPGIWRHFYLR
jgi:YVTN family beta-propeller protein